MQNWPRFLIVDAWRCYLLDFITLIICQKHLDSLYFFYSFLDLSGRYHWIFLLLSDEDDILDSLMVPDMNSLQSFLNGPALLIILKIFIIFIRWIFDQVCCKSLQTAPLINFLSLSLYC